jgi:GTP cyclohydrolase IA
MENMEKTDPVLGEKVRQHMISVGLETPMIYEKVKQKNDKKIKTIAKHFNAIMEELGLDMTDDSLIDTPNRVAKMYTREIFFGLNYDNFPKCTQIDNKMNYQHSFVLERNVNVQSNCEHHFVVIDGKATVAYIPKKRVLGLSKLNRIVQFYSKRPQVQERLTEQICEAVKFITESDDVAVYIDGVHYCVKSRGIQDVTSSTVTLAARGLFADADSEVRREFLNLARMK